MAIYACGYERVGGGVIVDVGVDARQVFSSLARGYCEYELKAYVVREAREDCARRHERVVERVVPQQCVGVWGVYLVYPGPRDLLVDVSVVRCEQFVGSICSRVRRHVYTYRYECW